MKTSPTAKIRGETWLYNLLHRSFLLNGSLWCSVFLKSNYQKTFPSVQPVVKGHLPESLRSLLCKCRIKLHRRCTQTHKYIDRHCVFKFLVFRWRCLSEQSSSSWLLSWTTGFSPSPWILLIWIGNKNFCSLTRSDNTFLISLRLWHDRPLKSGLGAMECTILISRDAQICTWDWWLSHSPTILV